MKIIATAAYERRAKRLLKRDEQTAMEQAIADDPQAHPVMPGTGGIRKARWAGQGRGKSGGVRTIYYHFVSPAELHLLFIYGKSEQGGFDRGPTERIDQIRGDLERCEKS